MEAASIPAPRHGRLNRVLRPFAFMSAPTAILMLFFLAPMAILAVISFQWGPLSGHSGFTFDNFSTIISDPLYRRVTLTTFEIATIAMLVQLIVAVPVAYVLAFKCGKFELPLLLLMVLADELNPMVRIYSWRMLLGREGIINSFLTTTGITSHPVDALLFSKFAVIVVLSTSYVTYTIIPIYAAMKAIDSGLFEAARDLGSSWFNTFRRVLLPLIMPGILIAMLLVYIPLFTDFASPSLVGGPSGYMLGNAVNDLVLESGNLNGGAALSLMMLIASAIFALVAYRLSKIRQLDTS